MIVALLAGRPKLNDGADRTNSNFDRGTQNNGFLLNP